jgi:methyl-accepting chemotaxis protein
MKLNDLTISTRLTLGFIAMALFISVLGVVSLLNLQKINADFKSVIDDRYPKVVIVNEMRTINASVAAAMRMLFIVSTVEDVKTQLDAIAAGKVQNNERMERLKASIQSDNGKEALARMAAARDEYRKPRDKLITLLKERQLDEGRRLLLDEVQPKQLVYADRLDDLIRLQDGLMAASGNDAAATVASARATTLALLGVAFVAAGALAWSLVTSTTRPINEAVGIAASVSDGDLSRSFKSDGRSETGRLLGGLHAMQLRLSGVVGRVRRGAEGVATASVQIAQGNDDLSSRTEQQASALQQTAASMEELSATVQQNAANAAEASRLAIAASTVAKTGGEVVGRVVTTMKQINDSSRQVADIVSVIDGIAFQTNILALNAAVEAARAGEQGRGFAVVASEVRTLAQRSAQAAKEIKGLIAASVGRVEQGSALVDQAGTTMQDVVASIARVSDIVGEISVASREQSTGVTQIGEAIAQMDEATQRNSALVEESAAAALSLKQQAAELVEAVAYFALNPAANATNDGMRAAA